MKTVIFLGPSLPLHEAQNILDAIYLPPAQQADLLSAAVDYQPDVIGLIDGVFFHSMSVWHKEILYALDQGILVYGASSMGALRAAETAEFGMIGIGEIYRQFASGELQDDDEVALAHATAEYGFRPESEPMVNVRATLVAAEKAGVIDFKMRSHLITIAKEMYFADRTFPSILQTAVTQGMSQPLGDELSRFVATSYVDLKRQDAIQLLMTIRHLPSVGLKAGGSTRTFAFARTSMFETLYDRDRHVQHNTMNLPLEAIGNYVALHDPDFDDLNFNALNRAVVFQFAQILGVDVSDDEIVAECKRFQKRRNLIGQADLSAWLKRNHLSDEEFRDLMAQVAICRRVQLKFLLAMWINRSTKLVLDELRLRGDYMDWVERTTAQEHLLQTVEVDNAHAKAAWIPIEDLVAEHCKWTDWKVDIDVASWAEEAGFHSEDNLRMELSRAKAARLGLLEMIAEVARTQDEQDELRPQTPSAIYDSNRLPPEAKETR